MSISAPYPPVSVRKDQPRSQPAEDRRNGISFRAKVILTLSGFGLLVWATVAVGMILNARAAVEKEVASSFDMATRYLTARKRAVEQAPPSDTNPLNISLEAAAPRHVRAYLIAPDGTVTPMGQASRPVDHGDDDDAPDWFIRLLDMQPLRTEIPASFQNRQWMFVLESHAYDEILEVWEDFRFVIPVTMLYSIAIIGGSIVAMNRVFGPLRTMAEGMRHLGNGRLDVRVGTLNVNELAFIAERFNELAERLAEREAENQRLGRRLLSVQDEERRRIAHDLHDELGPHLFGVRTVIDGLDRAVAGLEGDRQKAVREGLASLSDMTQTIQARTRKMISTLQPMSLGEAPVADLVEDIVANMRRFAPEAAITLRATTGAAHYGEAMDLTVHRFVQESVLNALRHGEARVIDILLVEDRTAEAKAVLRVRVADDGSGVLNDPIKPGYGLAGLSERVRALGGEWRPPRRQDGLTVTEVVLPVDGGKDNGAAEVRSVS